MNTSNQDWHPADIKAALEKADWNFSKISRRLGHKDKRTAYRVLRYPYPVVEQIVSELLGIPPQTIWPTRYLPDGSPKGRGIRRKYTKFTTVGNGKHVASA